VNREATDIIPLACARTLPGLFRERVRRSPQATAYIRYDESREDWIEISWTEMARLVARLQAALLREALSPGDRVAVMARNGLEWVAFDQAALGLGLVMVPLYTNDRPENIGYILQDAGIKILLIENNEQWLELQKIGEQLAGLKRVVTLKETGPPGLGIQVSALSDWLPPDASELVRSDVEPHALATIVYTSGTTGRSKGVMLSHHNILWNAAAALEAYDIFPSDRLLSFLPLSHMFERTIGYYLPMMSGSPVAYARSIPQLADDLLMMSPTILISVPRIFERIHARLQEQLGSKPAFARWLFQRAVDVGWNRFLTKQGRAPWKLSQLLWPLLRLLVAARIADRLGGRVRLAVSGGAPLAPEVARVFIGLGIQVVQGYGLTETSPVISGNPCDDNIPDSVGCALNGIEVRIGEGEELLTRSPSVMLGYWNKPQATADIIDAEGWLHTGDKARIEGRHIFITGRLKEIIVLANGEKVPPADMEMAITMDSLFEQVLVLGEGRPYLAALVVPDAGQFETLLTGLGVDPESDDSLQSEALQQALLQRITSNLHSFPGYARIHSLAIVREPWTVENGFLTPTLKLRRNRILEFHAEQVNQLYTGH
jgi:long-chain acyl-CoA synthetase